MHLDETESTARTPWTRRMLARGGVLLAVAVLVSGLAGSTARVRAADQAAPPSMNAVADEMRSLTQRLQTAQGELEVNKVQLERMNAIFRYSQHYQIPADLAGAIYDISLSEGIDPSVAFRLVKVESNFMLRATSTAGAIGYTQIRAPTAKYYEPGLSLEQLYDREVNLRIGFRFLKDLTKRYNQNVELALVAYNRGPARVQAILDQGGDPSNGYAQQVLKGSPQARVR